MRKIAKSFKSKGYVHETPNTDQQYVELFKGTMKKAEPVYIDPKDAIELRDIKKSFIINGVSSLYPMLAKKLSDTTERLLASEDALANAREEVRQLKEGEGKIISAFTGKVDRIVGAANPFLPKKGK